MPKLKFWIILLMTSCLHCVASADSSNGSGGQERLQQAAMKKFTFHAEPDPQVSSPVADDMIATISNTATVRFVFLEQSSSPRAHTSQSGKVKPTRYSTRR